MKAGTGRQWAVGMGLLMGILLLVYLLWAHGPHASFWPKCLFREFTGFHCAGCGMTRALHACVRGDLLMAFRYNPVMMGLILFLIIAFAWELLARCSGKPLPLRLRPSFRALWLMIALLLVFWVLRNIPAWPFSLLAPP